MKAFARVLDELVLTPSRNRKLEVLTDYFSTVSDPDRGLALAAITRDLDIRNVKPALLRELVTGRVDAQLFQLSYDFVGDMAETVSLIWPEQPKKTVSPDKPNSVSNEKAEAENKLSDVVSLLNTTGRSEVPSLLEALLDRMDKDERYALVKLATGGLRIGVSARLAKQALALFGNKDVAEIEELWHGLVQPYGELFSWLEGKSEKPVSLAHAPFRPVMLAHPLEERDHSGITPQAYSAEWKWDGIRVQLASEKGTHRIYSRTGDDISRAFPDLADAMQFDATLDGELLVHEPGNPEVILPFADLQKRLNRKTVTRKMLSDLPAKARLYDIMMEDGEDLRPLPFSQRRKRLEAFVAKARKVGGESRFDISDTISFNTMEDLARLRKDPPERVIEGLMLKRHESAYLAGRPRGYWFKWKREPFLIDAVLLYAQRGHGKRSGYYSDFTFGVWNPDPDGELVPVGKAYFGFTDDELKLLDKYVRENTLERFGPVRSVTANREKGLVLEVAFEGLNRSTRHKSGVAMRFPRISRLRWDKPAAEADHLSALEAMLP